MRICIGVDPGKTGAFAIIDDNGARVYPWDDEAFVNAMRDVWISMQGGDTAVACVEKVGAMPGQGVTSMFTFGKSAGFIEGVLAALGIPYQCIAPRRWKLEFGLNNDKIRSVETCCALFPNVALKRTTHCRRRSADMAEALLMAEYARRKM